MTKPHRLFLSPLSLALSGCAFRMADDTPATAAPIAPIAPTDAAPASTEPAIVETKQADQSDEQPATVAVDVPAEHVSLIKRAVALLERGEQWITDNIHAGISHFEGIVGETPAATHDEGDSNNA